MLTVGCFDVLRVGCERMEMDRLARRVCDYREMQPERREHDVCVDRKDPAISANLDPAYIGHRPESLASQAGMKSSSGCQGVKATSALRYNQAAPTGLSSRYSLASAQFTMHLLISKSL